MRFEHHREVLRIYLTCDRLLTVADLRLECASRGISISSKSLRRILNKHLRRVSIVRGLALTPANLRTRQVHAARLLAEPRLMANMFFPDEKLFCLESSVVTTAWKAVPKSHRNRVPQKRHPRRIMVWGGISLTGARAFSLVPYASDGTVTAQSYLNLLSNTVLPLVEAQDLLYQHDNAPSHVAVGPLALLRGSGRYFKPWPPNSPDFSPIEYVWAYMQGMIVDSLASDSDPEGLLLMAFNKVVDSASIREEIWSRAFASLQFAAAI